MVNDDETKKSITEEDIKKLTFRQLIKSLSIGAWGWIIAIFILSTTISYNLGYKLGIFQSSGNKEEVTAAQIDNPSLIDITGKVVDIFDNPRKDVTVILKGLQQYAKTDKKGIYHLSDIPFKNSITLEASYGEEKDSITVTLNKKEKIINIPDLLILTPVKIEAFLCRYVDNLEDKGLVPQGPFEEENPQISSDSLFFDKENRYRELWCFIKVIGPLKYEVGKEVDILYEWYYNDEIQGKPFRQSVGVSPFGWRTRASKKVWPGKWMLKIKTKHAELAKMTFEVY